MALGIGQVQRPPCRFHTALRRQHVWTCVERRLPEFLKRYGNGGRLATQLADDFKRYICCWQRGTHEHEDVPHGLLQQQAGRDQIALKLHLADLEFDQVPLRRIASGHACFDQTLRLLGER